MKKIFNFMMTGMKMETIIVNLLKETQILILKMNKKSIFRNIKRTKEYLSD